MLLAEIDRDVGVRLEDAELALALERHAAGGDVGDAAVGEAQARVGDVDVLREHRDADRLDALDAVVHQAQDQVEVVDHQVEDDVDVGAALGERREAVALDEARPGDDAGQGADRRVEALEVADLQDAPARVRRVDQRLPLRDRDGQRLLDEDVDALVEQGTGDRVSAAVWVRRG